MLAIEASKICCSKDLVDSLFYESFLICFCCERPADIVIKKFFKLFAGMAICHHYSIALSNHEPFPRLHKFTECEVCEV
ncbi:hypothetical protein JM78_16290 [Burkholderia pyrrocinia]|nr:hypothetical protein JM78_16290 [Burkholderia pyrrocinia]